ncbi:unnamed protein product [Pedinophyceae sp. YPF-701]|nr:unnamed protein product [Pedinophyceae sp. YPF-701]
MGAIPTGASVDALPWRRLGTPAIELRLDVTLPTGQSFRWRESGPGSYTGVIGQRVVQVRQLEDDVEYRVIARGPAAAHADAGDPAPADHAAVVDYFNLGHCLAEMTCEWAAADERFRDVHPHFHGARMLRQDPLETLFAFVCSQNNHISRIHGLVERLCADYGTPLMPVADVRGLASPGGDDGDGAGAPGKGRGKVAEMIAGLGLYAFPTLEQLGRASDEDLRGAGFGYRAKYIVGCTEELRKKEGGGHAWLLGLRDVGQAEAIEALCGLPGVGPKVAACVALFSLDKHGAIPVDTHVWQIAVRYYRPDLEGKSLTKRIHAAVEQCFVDRFGPFCGWAHNTLFVSELSSMRSRLPEHLRPPPTPAKKSKKAKASSGSEGEGEGVVGLTATPVGEGGDTEEPRSRDGGKGGDRSPEEKPKKKQRVSAPTDFDDLV